MNEPQGKMISNVIAKEAEEVLLIKRWRVSTLLSYILRDLNKNKLTEKWKHFRTIVLSGEENIFLHCAPGSTHCRPVRRYGLPLRFQL
jgi:hypothetical protein